MNLACKIQGHRLGNQIAGKNDRGTTCISVCKRCGHKKYHRYGDWPRGFGPRFIVKWPLKVRRIG